MKASPLLFEGSRAENSATQQIGSIRTIRVGVELTAVILREKIIGDTVKAGRISSPGHCHHPKNVIPAKAGIHADYAK
jgi:hypothetical protein